MKGRLEKANHAGEYQGDTNGLVPEYGVRIGFRMSSTLHRLDFARCWSCRSRKRSVNRVAAHRVRSDQLRRLVQFPNACRCHRASGVNRSCTGVHAYQPSQRSRSKVTGEALPSRTLAQALSLSEFSPVDPFLSSCLFSLFSAPAVTSSSGFAWRVGF